VIVAIVNVVVAGPNAAGLAYLAENAKKPGVISLASGLQYKVLNKGAGAFHPTVDSKCTCHYHGTLVDGSVFDSSVERGSPIDFSPNQVIKGWTEAMQLMVEGDKWELYISSDLAYGDRGSPPKIGGGDTLVFTIEMITIQGDKVPAITCDAATRENCNEKELKYIDKKNSGTADDLKKELGRLRAMTGGKMKPELIDWIFRRIRILEGLSAAAERTEL